jgi:exosortase/archaeosortase family protein
MEIKKSKKPAKTTEEVKSKKRIFRVLNFLARGTALLVPLLYLSYIKFEFQPFQELLFLQVVFLLKLIGLQFQAFGYTLTTQTFSSIITFDCTAWRQLYIYAALVLLPPGILWEKRLQGLLFLIPLYFYNTLRAGFSIWMGSMDYSWFKLVHWFLWEFLFLALIFIFWLYWFESAKAANQKI